jgi:WD40-like Beta Propeller Repeat
MLAPPRPPAHDELEALIREARQRQRRRRLAGVAAVAVLAAVALAAFGIDSALPRRSAAQSSLTPIANAPAFAGHGNLAFVSRDRLWLLDGPTRRLVRVAGAGASSPTFSPNGRWLAWSQGTTRFGLARSDGTGTRLVPSHDTPTWLPDGRLLVGRAIYRVAGGVPVEAGPAPKGLQSWTPDGTRYAFVEIQPSRHRAGSYNDVQRVEVSRSLNSPRKVWVEIRSRFTARSGFDRGAIGRVAMLPEGGVLVWLDPMHSALLAADGEPVYEIRSPRAHPERLGVTLGNSLSLGTFGRFALGAGGDRIAWTAKRVITCAGGRCIPLRNAREDEPRTGVVAGRARARVRHGLELRRHGWPNDDAALVLDAPALDWRRGSAR